MRFSIAFFRIKREMFELNSLDFIKSTRNSREGLKIHGLQNVRNRESGFFFFWVKESGKL